MQNQRLWRTVVVFNGKDEDIASFWLPAHSGFGMIRVPLEKIPAEIRSKIDTGFRCHVRSNVGAEKASDLIFSDWES